LGAVAIPASGIYLSNHHMSFATQRLMLRSQKLQAKLSSYGRDVMFPTDNDVKQLLREGATINVTDDGYITENSTSKTLVKWIPDGKIFTTTNDYTYAGRRIGSIKDGWCLVGGDSTAVQPIGKQGMQSEWIYDRVNQNTLYRQVSSRLPVLEAPEVLVWGTAYVPA